MARSVAIVALGILFIFASVVAAHWVWSEQFSLELAISTGTALISSLGILFLALQVLNQSRVSEAQFIESLAQDVDRNVQTELSLDAGGSLNIAKEDISPEEKAKLIPFLTFFERLCTMLDLGVGSMNTFNELFGYRFFLLMHNDNVQQHLLLNPGMKDSWTSLFRLHKSWVAFRRHRGIKIPHEAGLTTLEADDVYQKS